MTKPTFEARPATDPLEWRTMGLFFSRSGALNESHPDDTDGDISLLHSHASTSRS